MSDTSPGSDRPGTESGFARRRALVIGGGGSAGNAWLIGVLAGLAEGGVDLTDADLVVGTSAGATTAAQLTARTPAELLTEVLAAPGGSGRTGVPGGSRPSGGPGGRPTRPAVDHFARTTRVIAEASDADDMRRRMGSSALGLEVDPQHGARWRQVVATRLGTADWPAHDLLVTAVDARTGAPVVLDRDSGVDLVDAVAASCSSAHPYPVGERRYLDGGYRRNENADLAAGSERVVVLSPLGGRTRHPLEWRMQLAAQVEDLEAGGSRVGTVLPDAASLAAFGDDLMDPATRVPAARAGHAQGLSAANDLAALWGWAVPGRPARPFADDGDEPVEEGARGGLGGRLGQVRRLPQHREVEALGGEPRGVPAGQPFGAGLGVELDAPRALADPEGLVRAGVGLGQVHGVRRQRDDLVAMVLDGREDRRQPPEQRVVLGRGQPPDAYRTVLRSPRVGDDRAARDVREELGTEADAEQRDAVGHRGPGQRALGRQPRRPLVGIRHDAAPQEEDAVVPGRGVGDVGAVDDLEPDARLLEPAGEAGRAAVRVVAHREDDRCGRVRPRHRPPPRPGRPRGAARASASPGSRARRGPAPRGRR